MTPLQQAARNIILRWDSPTWKDQAHTAEYINALRTALEDEQAQGLEPVGVIQHLDELNAEWTKHLPIGTKLYTHPAPPPAKAQQVAVPDGWALVPTETMLGIKNRVNTLATLSLKAERYSLGREIKQDIATMLAAAQEAKPDHTDWSAA